MEKRKPSYTVGGNVNWYSHYGKWYKSEVAQLYPTLCDPMDCSPPVFSVHGIFQARVLEWVAISFSRGSSQLRDRTKTSLIVGRLFTLWTPGKSQKTVQRFFKKLGIELPYGLAIPLLGIYPDKIIIWKDPCIPMFIAALFTIPKTEASKVHQ